MNWWLERAAKAFHNWSFERSPEDDEKASGEFKGGLIMMAFLAGARWQAQTETTDRDYIDSTRIDFDTPFGGRRPT